MALWSGITDRLARRRVADEDAALKLARDALARAFDDEAERLNDGRALGYGHLKTDASQAAREAQDLGSFVRKLDPRDPRIEEALEFQKAGLLSPLDESARQVLVDAWPGEFNAGAKLEAAVKALHTERASAG